MLADGLWVEIESAKMEVDGVCKAPLVAEAMAPNLDRLDATVDAFGGSIADLQRCPPWRAKRRRVVPGSREATRDTRRAEGAKGDPKGASERGVQSYGRPVCSRNELVILGARMSQNLSRDQRLACCTDTYPGVAPATTARVVTWRRLATGRATSLCIRFPFHVDDDLPLGHIHLHIGDSPRCLNTQYLGV